MRELKVVTDINLKQLSKSAQTPHYLKASRWFQRELGIKVDYHYDESGYLVIEVRQGHESCMLDLMGMKLKGQFKDVFGL